MFPKAIAFCLMLMVGTGTALATKAKETEQPAEIVTLQKGSVETVGKHTFTIPPVITVEFDNKSYIQKKYNGRWWKGLTMEQRLKGQKEILKNALSMLHCLKTSPFAQRPENEFHTDRSRRHYVSKIKILHHEIGQTRDAIQAEKAAAAAAASTPSYSSPDYSVSVGGATSIDWNCIQSYEGAWDDTGDPFWGGLQFLLSTWYGWGGTGLPSDASPAYQIAIAEAAWDRSGHSIAWLHSQWPNSSVSCGY